MGKVFSDREEILQKLKGELNKDDVPAIIVEPMNEEELREVLSFSAGRNMKIAVASGLKPAEIKGIGGQVLILMSRFLGSTEISPDKTFVKVSAGLSVESLQIDLYQAGLVWKPLLPVPQKKSIGVLIASGWEGLRNWQDGGALTNIRSIEWMNYDGMQCDSENCEVDLRGFHYGARGEYGIITSATLHLHPLPFHRTAILLALMNTSQAQDAIAQLRSTNFPLPESVVYYGEQATQLLQHGNDTIPSHAKVLLMVEWRDKIALPENWLKLGMALHDGEKISQLWQDLFRLSRTASRLYPAKCKAKLRLPAQILKDFEISANQASREANLPITIWGTIDLGYIYASVLQPDNEPRTNRLAEETLERVLEAAVRMGGQPTGELPSAFVRRQNLRQEEFAPLNRIPSLLKERSDKNNMHIAEMQ